ncbi:ammonium transporter [Paludisphaera mucosa]|uniref:Ammonium transporter n=1 Tax=Paludisphaera mucosa TaxID=3030827 RepID=A0ABT6F9W3_9BACT|nr:ammonium transporter [Paludisphaera mucosa]MDG3004388.1 ammonium transporter [Paludisphaera mucosa]
MNDDAWKKEVIAPLAWGGGIVVVALGSTLARKLCYLDGDTVTRLVIGLTGLMIAANGNRLPKVVVPNAYAQRAKRGGWAMFLSGLVYAGVFAFAPIHTTVAVGCGAVAAEMVVTLGYCLWLSVRVKAV